MATTQPAGSKERGYLAKSFVILGLAFLLADFAFLAPSFEQLMESSSHGLDSLVPAIGLSLAQGASVHGYAGTMIMAFPATLLGSTEMIALFPDIATCTKSPMVPLLPFQPVVASSVRRSNLSPFVMTQP